MSTLVSLWKLERGMADVDCSPTNVGYGDQAPIFLGIVDGIVCDSHVPSKCNHYLRSVSKIVQDSQYQPRGPTDSTN